MDPQNYSRLLSYLACEMTIPTKKHVYNFAVSDLTSMNPQILSAAAVTANSQIKINSQDFTSNYAETSAVPSELEPSQELWEGTEIEKSALEDILYFSNSDKIEVVQKMTHLKETSTHALLKRELASKKEDQSSQLAKKKLKDGDTTYSDVSISSVNKPIIYNDSDPMLTCSDHDFKVLFKVSRSTFQILVDILSKEELEPIENVPLYKKVLIVLWLLGTPGSYNEAAQVFDVSEETVSSCFFDICATLYNKSETYIKWPTSEESEEIASRIENNFGFPGVVGVLGCQYFNISIPKESLSRREHFNGQLRTYCVSLQIVCDDEFVIRDTFPGLPGGIRPAQVLRDSPLGDILTKQATELIDPNKHILASSEFPQLTSMLTPYVKKSGSLPKEEEEFNALHKNVCVVVDQTFKMLKERFHILKLLDPEIAIMVLVTTCVLHNICIQNGDTYNGKEGN